MFIRTLHWKDEEVEFVEVTAYLVEGNKHEKKVVGYTNSMEVYEDGASKIGDPWHIDMYYDEFVMNTEEGISEHAKSINYYELNFSDIDGFEENLDMCRHYIDTMSIALYVVDDMLNFS